MSRCICPLATNDDKKCNYEKEVEYLRLTCAVREAKTLYTSILKMKMTLNEFNLMRSMFN